MSNCIFCKILRGEAPSKTVYHDELVTAFDDIHPVAPIHILIIPNKHIASIDDTLPDDQALLGHLLLSARQVARAEGVDSQGYRLVTNIGENGGQSVGHLHLHLLGGRKLAWPPG